MKKTTITYVTLILFLAIGTIANAQQQKLLRHAVGAGGFINKTSPAGTMSGIFGQAMAGKFESNVGGEKRTMYIGFWSPVKNGVGIDNDLILQRGIYNYPNPVSEITDFNFNLETPSYVTIRVFNTLGGLVATVIDNEMRPEGTNSIPWNIRSNGLDLSAGAYQYEMVAIPAANASARTKPVSFRNMLMISR